MARPKWATPERQARLIQLWAEYGNKCLLGHPVCPNLEHYAYTGPKRVIGGKCFRVVWVDKSGEPRRDGDGQRITTLEWSRTEVTKAIVHEVVLSTLYDKVSEEAIQEWVSEDRAEDATAWKRERRRLHSQPEFHKRGQYDSLAREIFLAARPLWDIEAVGVGAFTFQRALKVRIPGLDKVIWVNLPMPKGVSRNKRKKILKYGKGKLPEPEADVMYRVISEAVQRALSN